MLTVLLAAAGAATLVLSLILTAMAIRLAPRLGFVDRPGAHKSHEKATPYGGGVAIFLACWGPAVVLLILAATVPVGWLTDLFGETVRPYIGGLRERGGQTLIIFAGAAALHVMGLVDDRRPLGPFAKLAAMLGLGLVVSAVGGVRIAEFLGPVPSVLLTAVWIVIITNAFNFLDNMDGLSAGVATICTALLIACGLFAGQVLIPGLGCLLLGALLGFLAFNFPPAKIFMGDAGSLVVGYMMAVLSIMTSYWKSGTADQPFALAMPLVVLAVPLYDFTSVVIIRVFEGRNPFKGDQRHFSHRLVDRGLSRRFAVLTIYLATAATGLGATLLPGADLRQTLTVLAMVLMVLLIIAILEVPLRKAS